MQLKQSTMKKLFIVLLMLESISVMGQGLRSGSTPTSAWMQMFNPASVYYNTITNANQGTQTDTVTTVTTVLLATTSIAQGKVNNDTVLYSPLSLSYGRSVTFALNATKTGSTPDVRGQLQYSMDNLTWISSVGDTVHLAPTSTTTALAASITVATFKGRYYRWSVTTLTASARIWASWFMSW